MRVLREEKGFTLTEMIVVTSLTSLIVITVLLAAFQIVSGARETALRADARMVHIAAQAVIAEIPASDEDYTTGLSIPYGYRPLSGTLSPQAELISNRLNQLLASAAIPTDDPAVPQDIPIHGAALNAAYGAPGGTASFNVENGQITRMDYTATLGGQTYTITIQNGETEVLKK